MILVHFFMFKGGIMSHTVRHVPGVYVYYGQPVYYRLEERSSGPVINLSIRMGAKAATGRQGTPLGKPATWKLRAEEKDDPRKALARMVPKFLIKCLAIDRAEGAPWREVGEGCTLGVLWTVDFPYLKARHHWNRETCQRYQRAMGPLLEKFGTVPLRELTPASLGAYLDQLDSVGLSLLRRLVELERTTLGLEENPWIDVGHTLHRNVRSHRQNLQDNLRVKDLTTGQCVQIVRWCMENCKNGRNGSYSLAVLFLLLVGISPKELYGLRWEDVRSLRYYPCMTISISRVGKQRSGGKRYQIREILHGPRRRILAIPHLLVRALDFQRTRLLARGIQAQALGQLPLIGDPKNIRFPVPPDRLKRWIKNHIGPMVDTSVHFGRTVHPCRQLQTTALRNLMRIGFESDELRYHLGLKPRTTAAIYYNDFASEDQLYKRHLLQERWITRLLEDRPSPKIPAENLPSAVARPLARERKGVAYDSEPGQRLYLSGRISVPPLPSDTLQQNRRLQEEGLRIAVACDGGLHTAVIQMDVFEENGMG